MSGIAKQKISANQAGNSAQDRLAQNSSETPMLDLLGMPRKVMDSLKTSIDSQFESIFRLKEKATMRLQSASERGDIQGVSEALRAGADVTADSYLAVDLAVRANQLKVLRLLLANCTDLSLIRDGILDLSCRVQNPEMSKTLLEHGAGSAAAVANVLRYAASGGHLELAKLAIERGAKVSVENNEAIRLAARNGNSNMIKLLLEHGARLSANQYEALSNSAVRGHEDATKVMLEHLASDLHRRYNAALEWAESKSDNRVKSLLVSYREDHSRLDLKFDDVAKFISRRKIIRDLFKSHLLVAGAKDRALEEVAQLARPETIKLLLEHGANPSVLENKVGTYSFEPPYTARTFASFAKEAINNSRSQVQCKNFFDEIGISYPRSLKSDAFSQAPNCSLTNMGVMLLHASYLAAILGEGLEPNSKRILKSLIENDLKRVEETTGLSYAKYGRFLRERSGGLSDIKDVITEVTETLTLPKLASTSYIRYYSWTGRSQAVDLMLPDKSSLDFATLNYKWHRPGNMVPVDLRPYKRLGEWHALFELIRVPGGLTVECLTNPGALEAEGRTLNHCVGSGGYTSACQSGTTHIISIRQDGQPLATIELGKGKDIQLTNAGSWSVRQFKGKRNGPPPGIAAEAWEKAKEMLAEGVDVKISSKLGLTEESRSKMQFTINHTERIAGYPLDQIELYQAKILEHYATRLVIHRGSDKSRPVPLISGRLEDLA